MRRTGERGRRPGGSVPIEGVEHLAGGDGKDEARLEIEETRAAIRDSVERAKELIVEARFVIRQAEAEAEAAVPAETPAPADPPVPVPNQPSPSPGD